MKAMHPALARQLRKAGLSDEAIAQDERLKTLLKRIDASYQQWDRDRELLERSLLLTSEEMSAIYEKLRIETAEEKRIAEAHNRKLARALEQAGEAVIMMDADCRIEYINPAFVQLTGYRPKEILGESAKILNGEENDRATLEEMWGAVSNGKVWYGELVIRRRDGTTYPAKQSISPIFSDSGEVSHFISLHEDVSEQKQLEEQFYQAQKMEAVGTLVGGIAHDFNNTLAGITGNLYLAKIEAAKHPATVKRLETIEKLSFRASGMIQQLLTFSRKGTIDMHPVTIAPFLKEMARMYRSLLPESIRLTQEIPDSDMQIKGDINQLQQVIMNLLNNARDALSHIDNPEIVLELKAYEPDAAFRELYPDMQATHLACIAVTDNGCGMAEEELSHIFEPFYTTKDVDEGTGLGLAMVYGAVQSHEGIITVDSDIGKGTRFQLYLPLLSDTGVKKVSETKSRVSEGHGETVLLVDDDDTVASTGRDILEALGYKVLLASDGVEAVAAYEQNRDHIDLVMLDVIMPNKGGVEAAREIRNINEKAKVMFATGYDLNERLNAELMSRETVLLKPYSISDLSQAITAMLAESK